MTANKRLDAAIRKVKLQKIDKVQQISGLLGVTKDGTNQIEVPGRRGFVWVRLRNNLSELVQAFNENVSLVFGLPVLVERDPSNPSRYRVVGRDVGRYNSWGGSATGQAAHGSTHSFVPGGGGDMVWVYSQQFMPLLVVPSGNAGAMSLVVQPALYYISGSYHYLGGTGTANLSSYKPSDGNAHVIVLEIDPASGQLLISTGTMAGVPNQLTGTAELAPYFPPLIDESHEPLAAIRLLSGTSYLSWANLYDLRQIIHRR